MKSRKIFLHQVAEVRTQDAERDLMVVPHISLQEKPTALKITTQSFISGLVNDVLIYAFNFLDIISLSRISQVNMNWRNVSRIDFLWLEIIRNKANLTRIKTRNSFMNEAWKYRDISSKLIKFKCFDAAIEACQLSAKTDPHNGAYGFRDLCQKASDMKNYNVAIKCQQFAKQYFADAGSEAMSYIIKSQVKDTSFLENYQKLAKMSVDLTDDDREFGLQALIEVAKKLADFGKLSEAMEYTQLARTLADSKFCHRGRDYSDDIHPFICMSKHMISLKQYELAEKCARKLEERFCHADWLYADIIRKQIQEENFLNEQLFSEIKTETEPFIMASEGLVFGLINHGRCDEAKRFAKLRLEWIHGKYDFKNRLHSIIGCDVDIWLEEKSTAESSRNGFTILQKR